MTWNDLLSGLDAEKPPCNSVPGRCESSDHGKETRCFEVGGQSFFDESTEQSRVKATIVSKYFWAWAKVVMSYSPRIAYIDLFAGPGRYKDGTKSTPVRILEQAIADAKMREALVTVFNDVDSDNTQSLELAIAAVPGIETLKHKPVIQNEEVGDRIVQLFEKMSLVPTLFFVDPWGYKGLSLRLINSVLKDWGCDSIFFFNYNRINMGLPNDRVEEHMDALFGKKQAAELRLKLEGMSPVERELATVQAICESLQRMGGKFVLPFRFRNESGIRTSHHLMFVSKHVRGYEIMKGIMARESSSREQGVASFEYNPALGTQGLLFELNRPLDELGDMLRKEFAGITISMKEIYEKHHIGRCFIKSNYKSILLKLESDGKIRTQPAAKKRRKDTFADGVVVSFPKKK